MEDTAPAPVQPRRRVPGVVVAGILVAALGLGIGIGVVALKVSQHDKANVIRPSGIPAIVPTRTADLMQLSPIPHVAASNFTLTDQGGRSMSMAGLKGKAVVMEFMDPHCTDICPIVSQEFIEAYRDLTPAARARVVFLAVNVNEYHTKVSEMAAFTDEQHLNTVPTWHFLTGAVPELKSIWHAYGVEVDGPQPERRRHPLLVHVLHRPAGQGAVPGRPDGGSHQVGHLVPAGQPADRLGQGHRDAGEPTRELTPAAPAIA